MAEAIIKGVTASAPNISIGILEKNPNRKAYMVKKYGLITLGNFKEVQPYKIIIIAVKPQTIPEIIDELSKASDPKTLTISIAAGTSLSYLRSHLSTQPLVRVMPNTPALINSGISGIAFSKECSDEDKQDTISIFQKIGSYLVVEEDKINAITAMSGSGPAYFYYLAELFANHGKIIGLSYEDSLKLVCHTMIGAGKMMLEGKTLPPELIRQVTSPGGTTEAALNTLNISNISDIIKDTILSAKNRAIELDKKN